MERKDLKPRYGEVAGSDPLKADYAWVYPQAEADAVMDGYEAEIKHLDSLCIKRFSKIHKLANDLENANARIKELEKKLKEIK